MSGVIRLSNSLARRGGRIRQLTSIRAAVTPPNSLVTAGASTHQNGQQIANHSRHLSSLHDRTTHEEATKEETPATREARQNVRTMDREKIRQMRYIILQHSKKRDHQSAYEAQKLLTQLAEESISQGRTLANSGLHNSCLNAWARGGGRQAILRAGDLLQEMWARHKAHPEICPAPNLISYHSVLDACGTSSSLNFPKAAEIADELIKEMEQHALDNPEGDIHPTTWSYNLVMSAHANQSHEVYLAANAAEDWLRYLSKSNTEGGPGPNTASFNIVLKAWCQCPENKGADRALELLNLMIKLFHEGHQEQVSPDHWSFGTVIQAFADRGRPEEAEEVLRLALAFYLDDATVENKLNVSGTIDLRACFNIAINGWARSDSEDATEKADALLFDMKALSQETRFVITQPDAYSYTSCMAAIAKSGRKDAPEMVESRLYGMLEQHRRHKNNPPPNSASFDCAIRAWYRSQKPNRAERMEDLLNTMLELGHRRRDSSLLPKPATVNQCLKAWCRVGKGMERGLALLNRMEIVKCVDTGSYLQLIMNLLQEAKRKKYDADMVIAASVVLEKLQVQINNLGVIKWHDNSRHYYHEVIKALNKVGTTAAADRAYIMLEAMESNSHKRSKPTSSLYTSAILGMARTPQPKFTQRAINIFEHMMRMHYDAESRVRIDTSSFVAMMTYLANTRERWAADRCDALLGTLTQMNVESVNADKSLKPDFRCYDKCLQARARSGDLCGAVQTLKRFVEDYRDARALDAPSEMGIDSVHLCCTQHNGKEAMELAEEVLAIKEMLRNEGNLRQRRVVD